MEINVATILIVLGVLVFTTNIIVQVTKEMWPFSKIKTNYYVLAVSTVLSILTYAVYISYTSSKMVWYYIVGALLAGVFVAYISMYGWDKFISEWEKANKKVK